jgi:putative endonuclease
MLKVSGWTYMLASGREGTLYCGVTTDLLRRVWMHKEGLASHYTRRYGVTSLVWYEPHARVENASRRVDLIRHRSRQWKLNFITRVNPEWIDLYHVIMALPEMPVCTFLASAPPAAPP